MGENGEMKKRWSAAILCILLVMAIVWGMTGCTEKEADKDIVILFTNDVHCAVDDAIGYAGLASYKKKMMQENAYVTLVDCGDHVQGAMIGKSSNGESLIQIMNQVGYEFASFGNHEFDFGPECMEKNIAAANMQYLCCNVEGKGEEGKKVLEKVKPYEIVSYGDKKVGFIGVLAPDTPQSVAKNQLMKNGEYLYNFIGSEKKQDLYDCVQKNIDECRSQGADYIIVLGHIGVPNDESEYSANELIAATSGVDVFLDGHTHTKVPCAILSDKNGADVLYSQTGNKLNMIGQLLISSNGLMSVTCIEEYNDKDAETEEFVQQIKTESEKEFQKVVGHTDQKLAIEDESGMRMVRSREVGLGDFVADAFRINGNADIAFVNGGGVRAAIQPGDIKLNDLLNVCPFGNTLCVMEMSGAEILDMLEYGCRFVRKDYAVDGRVCGEYGNFLQVSGVRFTVDTSVESTVEADADDVLLSIGEKRRVSDVQVLKDGEYVPLDPEAMYTVASSNYIFKDEGSGMSKRLEGHPLLLNESMSDIDMLVNYINMLGGDLTQYAQPDGRITIK